MNSASREKKQIFYARTYKHTKIYPGRAALYLLIVVLPAFLVLVHFLPGITDFITQLGLKIIGETMPELSATAGETAFSVFFNLSYIELPTVLPSFGFSLGNLIAVAAIFVFFLILLKANHPTFIFLLEGIIVHTISSLYFMFAAESFPYTASEFSAMYMKQQVSIWILFLIMSGLITGFLGNRGYPAKVLCFLGIMGYSLVYGCARYMLFMWIISRASIIYIPLMFFVFGPLMDFVYFVTIYSIYSYRLGKVYDTNEGRGDWEWM